MVGIITVHPPERRSVSLLTSSFTIWITNVLTFSLLYWQIDAGGPSRIARGMAGRSDWLFPQASAPEQASPDWRPLYIDYLSLAFNTATAFSPTDVLPLARRAKGLMMLESAIALLTLVLVARACSQCHSVAPRRRRGRPFVPKGSKVPVCQWKPISFQQ
ncbi:hypothetical protein ACOJBO_05040 [Rhizobium beringeri]